MTTTSYPIEGKNLTSAAWSKMQSRHHQGIDVGMALSLSSTSNDATIASGRCNFAGFELEVAGPHVVTLPAVTAAKTYVIGVLYTPANEGLSPDGPLSLVSGTKGAISVPSGGAFWPLWEVTRQPSQTLNLATVRSYAVSRLSVVYAAPGVSDPDPAFAQGGALLVRRSGLKVGVDGQWNPVGGDTGDVADGFVARSGWSQSGTVYRILNGQVTLHLRALRNASAAIASNGSGSVPDVPMLVVPTAARPTRKIVGRGLIELTNGSNQAFDWFIDTSGEWTLYAANPNISFGAGSLLWATASYAL